MTPGQAACDAFTATGRWEAAAQAAIAAAPACPCGGMPGTACGDLIVHLRADIVRMEADALAAIKAESSAVTALEAEVAAITANRDAWCDRASELLTEAEQLRALAAELLAAVPPGDFGEEQFAKWRKRAGLEG